MVLMVVDTQKLITNDNLYNKFMWKGRYAECVSIEEALALL